MTIPAAAELEKIASTRDDCQSRRVLSRPLVLWNTDPRRGRLVVACCRRAAAAGVRSGMSIANASELTTATQLSRFRESASGGGEEKSAGVQPSGRARPAKARTPASRLTPFLQQHDRWLDQEALESIASDLQRNITPLVAIEALDDQPWAGQRLHQPQALLCDVTGIAHLFRGEQELLRATRERLAKFGCVGRMAIADNAAAAWALAHYATTSSHRSGRESTESFVALPGNAVADLSSLGVQALRIAPATVDTLHRLGVETISQLLSLPRGGLAARLGETLVDRLSQALGEVDVPLQVHRPIAEDTASLELEYPSGDRRILADRIRRLVEKVRAGLATRQRGALRISCRLALSDLPPLTFDVGLFAPTLDVDHLTRLLVTAAEAKPLPGAVTHVAIEVTLSGPLRSSQSQLFATDSTPHTQRLNNDWTQNPASSRLIDALSGRLGRDAVVGVSINENPLPEQAATLFPLTGNPTPRTKKQRQTRNSRSQHSSSMHSDRSWFRQNLSHVPTREDPIRRPLALLTKPLQIAEHPGQTPTPVTRSNELPAAFRHGGKIHRIVRYWGPERIETDWWQGDSIRRDYYRIETHQGHWWWVFRCLGQKQNRWMLHGYF